MEHPADKGFNSTWEGFKHIASKTLKWAAYGAMGLAALSFVLPITPIVGAIGGIIGMIVPGMTAAGTAAAGMLATVAPFLKVGAVIGAIAGAISGVGGLNDAIEDAKMDRRYDYEQTKVAMQREELMRGRGQRVAMAGGVSSPSVGMGAVRQGLGV